MFGNACLCVCVFASYYMYYFNRIHFMCVRVCCILKCIFDTNAKPSWYQLSAKLRVFDLSLPQLFVYALRICWCVYVDFKRFDCDSFYFNFCRFVHYLFLFISNTSICYLLSSYSFGLFFSLLCFDPRNDEIRAFKLHNNMNKCKMVTKSSRNKLYTKMMMFLFYNACARACMCVSLVWSMPEEEQ